MFFINSTYMATGFDLKMINIRKPSVITNTDPLLCVGIVLLFYFENYRKNKHTVWINAGYVHSEVGGAAITTNQANTVQTCISYFFDIPVCINLVFTRRFLKGFNLLKSTGHVIHQQFNIQQLYVLPTLYLCVLYLSENKQRLVPLTA